MKTTKFLSNAFGLYLFEHKYFLNIANKVKFKTAIFSLFLLNLIFSIIGNFIFKSINSYDLLNTIIYILISSTIGFLVVLVLIFIFSGIIHLIYKLFDSNAKLKKLIIMNIAVNEVFFILYFIFGGILFYLIKHPNLPFHTILFSLFSLFNIVLIIWSFIVAFENYGKIERVSKLKSFFAYLIIFLIIIWIIFYFKFASILTYLKSIYGF